MSWKDNLRPASFKGNPFYVEDHDMEFGRRLNPNEYPYRDEPYTEDMGRRARRYDMQIYFIGDDYMDARDAFIDAIESGGPGPLVHPYIGTKSVIGEVGRLRETKDEGGYAVVSITFIEAGSRQFPSGLPIPEDMVTNASSDLISVLRDAFTGNMTVDDVTEWVRTTYGADLSAAADIFDTIQSAGGINKQSTTALINKAAEWVADITDLSSPSISLIQDLAGTADKVISAMSGVFTLSPSAEKAAENLRKFSDFTATLSRGETQQTAIANTNAETLEGFVRGVSVATEATAVVAQNFKSYEDAVASRHTLLDRIDALAEVAKDDNVYNAYTALRAAVAGAVPGEDNSLPRLASLVLKQSSPSLVSAYELYGDVSQEQDILDRNKIRHPGYMPGGQNLSVLKYVEDSA